ncbi:YgfX family protein [Dyella flagellata]|uniref:Toxin CptA n=1 Tax=Dyella flagellata TaxID=1867833 RepID=A0ABQ5X5X7_9GAMM|nr:hypothetical protein [Dyella flagellata]GLQ86973.1 hypothetical protein GCM10007898_05390 [Dyella flagellata]
MTSAPAIGFEYRPSRWVSRLFAGVTGLAAIAVAVSGLPLAMRIVLVLVSIGACLHAIRRQRVPIRAVGWAGQSGWTLRGLDGGDDAATLLSFRVIHPGALIRLASQRYGKLTLWLMPDNTDSDIRRRLRMRLAVVRAEAQEHP